ncbi:HAUS augmin-like complex subunit 3 [Tiliqua scincoides]|uniref:HAUS augmin-like complex subunit 3 n=1 Tax=Tiliqua scincoides TaxID=71010 RepID=UPI003461F4D8
MLTRRRSSAFLLDTVNKGAEFVQILKIVYPKANELHEKDFDWLFDCAELEHFLEWFCNTVGEENVLSATEVEAYENLLISGKPLLEKDALEQVLKTCHQSPQLRDTKQENETPPLETLEKEMQMLKSQSACRIKRCNKLRIHEASTKQEFCHLEEKMEKASRWLKKAHLQLELDNFQSNDVFSQTCKIAKELVQWHRKSGNEWMKASVAMTDLRHYLESEEKFTQDLLGFFPKALKSIINEAEAKIALLAKKTWGGSQKELSTENITKLDQKIPLENKGVICSDDHNHFMGVLKGQGFYWEHVVSKDEPDLAHTIVPKETEHPETEKFWTEALDIHYGSQRRLKTKAPAVQVGNCKDGNLGSYQEELGNMELTYLHNQRLLVMTSAEIEGTSSALQWARKALKAAKKNKIKEEEEDELRFHIAACQEQRSILQNELDQVTSQKLVPLLQGNARLLRLPVIRGKLNLEAIKLGHVESIQEKTAAQLMGQLSHLEVLRLLLMLEDENLRQMNTEMLTIVNESETKLQKWQSCLEGSTFSIKQRPQTLIDPSDLATLRVWKMLDRHGQEKQLFRSYETLAGWGSRLCQELKMLQVQLVAPLSQLPKLESDHEILYSKMYGDSNQLMLHAQEVSESLAQLGTTQAKLYQMLMDTLSDWKVKHKSLRSHVQHAERNLYMHFFNNPTQLKKLVEELEEKANRVCF